jgi:hypothetical protein
VERGFDSSISVRLVSSGKFLRTLDFRVALSDSLRTLGLLATKLKAFNLIGGFDFSISGSLLLIHSGGCVVDLQCLVVLSYFS